MWYASASNRAKPTRLWKSFFRSQTDQRENIWSMS
jgi:hypothetical protein